MKFSDMMIISEAAQGYTGGYSRGGYDHVPTMSLEECVHSFTMDLLESQAESFANMNEENEMLVEATVNAIRYGSTADYDSLIEGAFANMKEKIKKFFEKIKKWIQSIIAKLKVAIDKIRMSGTQLWSKYGDSVRSKNFGKIDPFNGHVFNMTAVDGFVKDSSNDFCKKLIMASVGEKVPDPDDIQGKMKWVYKNSDDTSGNLDSDSKKALDALKNSQSNERKARIIAELVGPSLAGKAKKDSWKQGIHDAIWGQKKEIKFGTGDFNLSSIESILKDDCKVALSEIESEYEKLHDAVKEMEDAISKAIEEYNDDLEKLNEKKYADINTGTDAEKTANKVANNQLTGSKGLAQFMIDYLNGYIAACNDVYAAINDVKSIRQAVHKERYKQATSMLSKLISYNEKKNNNDSSDVEELDVIDFEL